MGILMLPLFCVIYVLPIPMTVSDLQTQCVCFEKKRYLLASMIRIAQDINRHSRGLEDVLLLARPSQDYPVKVEQYIALLESKTAALSEIQLRQTI